MAQMLIAIALFCQSDPAPTACQRELLSCMREPKVGETYYHVEVSIYKCAKKRRNGTP